LFTHFFMLVTKQINILVLLPYPVYPANMGGQKAVAYFYKNLSEELPVILAGTKNNIFPAGEGRFLPLLSNSVLRYADVSLYFKLKTFIKKNNITHLFIEHPYLGWLGVMLQKNTGVNLIVRSHNIEAIRFKSIGKWWWRLLWLYEKWVHRQAHLSFFITEDDRQYALRNYNLPAHRAHVITYGFALAAPPEPAEKEAAKKLLANKYNFSAADNLLFFNGTLSYRPNLEALKDILFNINPLLLKEAGYHYKIFICGKGLPVNFAWPKNLEKENIIYAGYVPDIEIFYRAADIFINPVTDGGGIKTKLVEALGYNITSISYKTGATGIPPEIGGDKLILIPNKDATAFAKNILRAPLQGRINTKFYSYFNWGNIAKKAAGIIRENYKTL
jgi:polysaccharide biosynthesis protein PslH